MAIITNKICIRSQILKLVKSSETQRSNSLRIRMSQMLHVLILNLLKEANTVTLEIWPRVHLLQHQVQAMEECESILQINSKIQTFKPVY
jgi:hypothetical protein